MHEPQTVRQRAEKTADDIVAQNPDVTSAVYPHALVSAIERALTEERVRTVNEIVAELGGLDAKLIRGTETVRSALRGYLTEPKE
jgi:hypothetical protein